MENELPTKMTIDYHLFKLIGDTAGSYYASGRPDSEQRTPTDTEFDLLCLRLIRRVIEPVFTSPSPSDEGHISEEVNDEQLSGETAQPDL